jgi:hypothetical protein
MPGLGAARRAAGKSARGGKKGKKKPARSGDPRRAAEVTPSENAPGPAAQGAGTQDDLSAISKGLGGLPDGFPDNLAEGLAGLQPGLNFPPTSPGNVPAAFRGGNPKRRDKKK